MNPWLAMLMGFVGGFFAGSLCLLGVSMLMTYSSAIINQTAIDEEIERRENEKEENEKGNQDQ